MRESATTPIWWPFLLAAAALALYANALPNPFISDDEFVIVGNPTIKQPSLVGLTKSWTVGYLQGIDPQGRVIPLVPGPTGSEHTVYRPITTFAFWLNAVATGVTPIGFRIVNVLLHAAAAWMVGRWCAAFLGGPAGLIAALLVLCHPLATDVINRIVGRADILVLLAVPGFLVTQATATASRWTWGRTATAALWASIAIGAKEMGAVLLPLAALQALIDRTPTAGGARDTASRHAWRGGLALLVPFACYFAGRLIALGVQAPYRADPSWDLLGNPLIGRSLVERLPASAALAASYLRMLVWPWPLMAFDTPAHLPAWSDAVAWLGLAAVVALALGAAVLAMRRNPLALPLAWWLACFLIVGQLIAPIHPYREVRLAYAMVGALGFVGGWVLGSVIWPRSSLRAAALAATAILCVTWSALIVERNTHFQSLGGLVAVDARLQPDSGAAASRLGKSYEQQGRLSGSASGADAGDQARAHVGTGMGGPRVVSRRPWPPGRRQADVGAGAGPQPGTSVRPRPIGGHGLERRRSRRRRALSHARGAGGARRSVRRVQPRGARRAARPARRRDRATRAAGGAVSRQHHGGARPHDPAAGPRRRPRAARRAVNQATSPRAIAVACALLLAVVLAMFGDVLVTDRILSKDSEDLSDIFLHWHQFGFRELASGNLPLWNPHIYSGAPYFGSFQPGLLYPPNWLGLVLAPAAAINLGIALHFFLAGLWTYLWTARRGLHPAACLLAAIIFMLCGAHFLQLYRGHVPTLRTVIWAPLVLLAIDGWLETRRARWVLLGMAAVALQTLAGLVQQTFYTALIAGLYATLCSIRSGDRIRFLLGVIGMYAGGAALAAVQILAGLDAVSEGVRGRLAYDLARSFAFPPENLLTLVLPGVFGDMVSEPYFGRWTLSEMSLFIGCGATLLALHGAVTDSRARRRFSVSMTLIVLALAFGYYTPLFRLLYDYVPGFASFRGTTKFTFLASLFLAMLAAAGFDLVLRAPAPSRWPALVALGAGILLLAGAGSEGRWAQWLAAVDLRDEAFGYYPVDRGGDFVVRAGKHAARSMLVAGTTFLVLAGLWLAARWRRRLAFAIAVLSCVELFVYARSVRLSFDPGTRLRAAEEVRNLMARSEGYPRVLANTPYLAMSAGSYDLWGYDPMVTTRYAEFLAYTQNMRPADVQVMPLRRLSPLFGMLRLRYLLRVDDAHVRAIPTNLPELPRAQLVSEWRVIPDPRERLAALADPRFDPRSTVLLEAEPNPLPAADGVRGSVSLRDVSSDAIEVRAELPAPAILVIGDGYSAGWKATALAADAQQTYAVMPADHILRAIPLAAGTHHLRVEYRPAAFVAGAWITTAALGAYVLALVGIWRRRPSP